MAKFKEEISKALSVATNIEQSEIASYLEIPKEKANGDYAFPCFRLAKQFRKAPSIIAEEIKENLVIDNNLIEKIEIVSGYINFYINRQAKTQEVLRNVQAEAEYGKSSLGEGKTIVIDYSAPNIAKPFHIGHLKTTVIDGALYNIYKYLGYKVIGINYLVDYGTQFGKLIEGYKMWGNEYDLSQNPIDKLADIYKRINNLCNENEEVLNRCRENFKLLEEKDEYCTKIWNKFRDLSIKEFQKIYDLLGSKFDSWDGEAFISDKTGEVIAILEKTGKLVESEGAKIIDLSDKGIDTPCIICKSNGSTIYATRDLAAILYRARKYDFDKCIYVTSYEQNLHFKQIFEVAKLLGLDEKYTNGLEHVQYGMVRLPTGKMSTRQGNFIKIEDLLNDTISKAKEIISEKNPNLENKDEVAEKVGIGAVIFNNLATSRMKDEVFDINEMLNFQGETGPYIQYSYVRIKSVLEKAGYMPEVDKLDMIKLNDEYSRNLIDIISNLEETLIQVINKSDPSILARYLIDLAKAYSSFYNENKIICEDKSIQDARVYLSFATGKVLKQGSKLLGIEMPDKM